MLSVNRIANGLGETVGWAVLEDKMRTLAEFKTVEEACTFEAAYVKPVPYLYRPIAMYGGKVLKCCGMASDVSRAIVSDKSIGKGLVPDSTLLENGVVVETSEYRGDRITKDASGNYVTFNGI